MRRQALAIELIPALQALIEESNGSSDPTARDRRAALWRAQQRAVRPGTTLEELRRFCLDSLRPRRFLDADDPMRGYREGFQAVLLEIRRLETGPPPTSGV